MPDLYFFPNGDGVSPADVQAFATTSLAGVQPDHADPSSTTLGRLPDVRDQQYLLSTVAADRHDEVQRYWARQRSQYADQAEQLLPPAGSAIPLRFAFLRRGWRGYAPGTIAAIRETEPVGVLGVFGGWTVDAAGTIAYRAPVTHFSSLAPMAATSTAAVAVAADSGSQLFDYSATLIEYISQGLSGFFPVAGPLISAIVGAATAVGDAMDRGTAMLDAFAEQLKANDATLETDLATAEVMTYQQWAARNYQDQWLHDVMYGDATSSAVLNEKKALDGFVTTVSGDLASRDARILTAVNLMMTESPAPNANLNDPSLAMLKASGFFYLANYVLTLGRQAFNAQLTMEGDDAAAEVGKTLASLSTTYTKYATALKTAVLDQWTQRVNCLHLVDDTTYTRYTIYDDYDPKDPTEPAGYERAVYTYCGNTQASEQWPLAQAEYARIRDSYLSLFWGGDPAKRSQAVEDMQANDVKLQALTTPPGPGA